MGKVQSQLRLVRGRSFMTSEFFGYSASVIFLAPTPKKKQMLNEIFQLVGKFHFLNP